MFTKITLENFRSFDHIVFDLTEKGNVPKHLAVLTEKTVRASLI